MESSAELWTQPVLIDDDKIIFADIFPDLNRITES